jgi:hypothetical protein
VLDLAEFGFDVVAGDGPAGVDFGHRGLLRLGRGGRRAPSR